ncbi:hypothetical protein MTR_8g014240 [Medicago truncatula]|uniref:Uncharacterized protein n=1 Tax=Medicago truncatula TaxID=3880 RepID=G7LGM2_MEDTR|nr:hypothetical protein MTR_8g014240 [Medicago truncatula]
MLPFAGFRNGFVSTLTRLEVASKQFVVCVGLLQGPKINQSAKAEFLALGEICPEPTRFKRVKQVQEDKGHVELIHWSRADFVQLAINEFLETLYATKPYTLSKQRESRNVEEHKKFLEALKLCGRPSKHIKFKVGLKFPYIRRVCCLD